MNHGSTCTCGCCDGIAARAPVESENAPLLPEIRYRSGDWQSFRQTMLARLSSEQAGALAALGTRSTRDATIGLIDAWATVGDIMTFYNERLLSEAMFRTAGENESLHELAQLIGYQPSPGVAASADIAFRMDETEGAPRSVTLETGIKVQSTPGPDEEAVIYETVEPIEARPAWNALRPQLHADHALTSTTSQLWLPGSDAAVSAGDGVLYPASGGPYFAIVTRVDRINGDRSADPDAQDFTRLSIRRVTPAPLHDDGFAVVTASIVPPEPAASYINRTLASGDLAAELTAAGHDEAEVFEIFETSGAPQPYITHFPNRASMFGHNAQPFSALPAALTGTVPNYEVEDGVVVADGVINGPFKGLENQWADGTLDILDENGDGTLHFEGAQPSVADGALVVLRDGDNWAVYQVLEVSEASYARFALSGKATRVQLSSTTGFGTLTIRGTVAFTGSTSLQLARPPLTHSVSDGSIEPITLDSYAPGLQPGGRISITGKRLGNADSETAMIATVSEVVHDFSTGGTSAIRFDPPLPGPFTRDSVRINANVAAATHGESVTEILGDGDGTPFRSIALKQMPQTHVTGASASGAIPTLEVRINDIRWQRVDTLLDAAPEDRVYTTRITAEGKTIVQFGGGSWGAQPSTGKQNMHASYRKNLGLAGRVGANALNVLMSRPLGLAEADNPLPSSGGADPESLEAIRENAPLTVRTLDRAVSPADYEDYARGFTGIAKAEARLRRKGVRQLVHLTIAGEEGEEVVPGSALYDGLAASLAAASDPYRAFLLSGYRPATFRFGARIKVHPDHLQEVVFEQVEQQLRRAFGFEERRFSQTVWMSQILAEIHSIAGVEAADVTILHRDLNPDGTAAPVGNFPGLAAAPSRIDAQGTALGAELLTLHAGPLEMLEVLP